MLFPCLKSSMDAYKKQVSHWVQEIWSLSTFLTSPPVICLNLYAPATRFHVRLLHRAMNLLVLLSKMTPFSSLDFPRLYAIVLSLRLQFKYYPRESSWGHLLMMPCSVLTTLPHSVLLIAQNTIQCPSCVGFPSNCSLVYSWSLRRR